MDGGNADITIKECMISKNKESRWILYKDNDNTSNYLLVKSADSQDDEYILGADKFPLPEKKLGILNNKLNKFIDSNTDSKIKNARFKDDDIYLRRTNTKPKLFIIANNHISK